MSAEHTEHSRVASAEDILACSIDRWYPLFQRHSPRTTILPLPDEFVRYLHQDSVILPSSAKLSRVDDGAEADGEEDDENDAQAEAEAPHFPELDRQIEQAIEALGGSTCIKLNWSTPIDAAWVTGTIRCYTPGDVYLLLKSSDRVAFDLEHMFDLCGGSHAPERWCLALRKWCNYHPSMGFRCFVQSSRLLAICQRDCTSYFDFLEAQLPEIEEAIVKFFYDKVCNVFPLPDYVLDVYVDKSRRVWIVDFNPYGEPTETLLFTYEELDQLAADTATREPEAEGQQPAVAEFRIVESQSEVLQSAIGRSRGPVDTPHFGDASSFEEFMKQCVADRNRAGSSDDEDTERK